MQHASRRQISRLLQGSDLWHITGHESNPKKEKAKHLKRKKAKQLAVRSPDGRSPCRIPRLPKGHGVFREDSEETSREHQGAINEEVDQRRLRLKQKNQLFSEQLHKPAEL